MIRSWIACNQVCLLLGYVIHEGVALLAEGLEAREVGVVTEPPTGVLQGDRTSGRRLVPINMRLS